MNHCDGHKGGVGVRSGGNETTLPQWKTWHDADSSAHASSRKEFDSDFSTFFSRTVFIALSFVVPMLLLAACEKSHEPAPEADLRPASDPAWKQVDAIVREVRAVLPGLPSQGVAAPDWPDIPHTESATRLVLSGAGRLLLAAGAEGLPGTLHVELHLDARDPPGGHLLMKSGAGEPARWPILSSGRTGSRDGDFAYTFRLSDPENRVRYLALLGVRYGTGVLRFRAFEGYLIVPGKGGALSGRPPLYPIDFGYHWPLPPRHEARLETLRREQETLAARLAELARLDARAAEARRAEQALAASAVPEEQEALRRAELAELADRQEEAERARRELAGILAAALEQIYRLRAEMARDWEAFRQSNPYRWMDEGARLRSFAALQQAAPWQATWRQAFDAVGGAERLARPALASAREAMERALLRELEAKP